MPNKRRSFSPEYKAEVVELIRSSDKSLGQIVCELGLSETAVRRWVDKAEAKAGTEVSGVLGTDERAELDRLRRENSQLTDGRAL